MDTKRSDSSTRLPAYVLAFFMLLAHSGLANSAIFIAETTGSLSNLTLDITTRVDTNDRDVPLIIYVIALYNGEFYAQSNDRSWSLWNVESALPIFSSGSITYEKKENIFTNLDVNGLIGTKIYIGYGRTQDDMLESGTYALAYIIGIGPQ